MNKIHHKNTNCRLCKKNDLTSILRLQSTPPANEFVSEDKFQNQSDFLKELKAIGAKMQSEWLSSVGSEGQAIVDAYNKM